MFFRFAAFILVAVVSMPSVTAICDDDNYGISADIHPEDTGIHQLRVYNNDCDIHRTYNFTTDDDACESGSFECGPPPLPFISYTDGSTDTTYPCHIPESNSETCAGVKIVACCRNDF